MIYLFLVDHSYGEVPNATTAEVQDGQVVCRNVRGSIVAMLDSATIIAFGTKQVLKQSYRTESIMAEPITGL